MAHVSAVDVGGTFTDLVVLESESGAVESFKVPTTPEDPAKGILEAVAKAGIAPATFFHGTTVGLNTLLEHKGAKTGLITTQGFRDALEIARMWWPMYQLHWAPPAPLVPRRLRVEVGERMLADGSVLHAIDDADVERAAAELVEAGVEVIAICFLHAYANPAHEERALEIIEQRYPDIAVTISSQVSQEYREYERTATTVADGMIRPRMRSYIDNLDQSLRADGFEGNLFITRCDGGVMSAAEAKRRPIRTLVSGPASGVMGAVSLGRLAGALNLITIDMGGTSFDASLVIDGQPSLAPSTNVEGIPMLVPVIEIETIGAGGGSIAWIDGGGALNVGPESAGAVPGPISYMRGGEQPTFTDAALVSGILNEERFLGGEMEVDVAAAEAGIEEQIAAPLGLDTAEAASGIVALTEAKMAATLEEMTIGKGHDPRDFTLVAYGGGGPLVACSLATRLAIPRVIVPPSPATLSAWGMLTLDIVHDLARSQVMHLSEVSPDDVRTMFSELASDGQEALAAEDVREDRRRLVHAIDMRYDGQEHTLTIAVDDAMLANPDMEKLRDLFGAEHEVAYGYQMPDPVEVTAFRVRAIGELDEPRMAAEDEDAGAEPTPSGVRTATHHGSGGRIEWKIYDRDQLLPGQRLSGPAIVEETATTVLVSPQQELSVDGYRNLIIETVSVDEPKGA